MINYGENLKACRTYRGMTQRELADKAGVTQGHIAQIESGKAWPSLPVALSLAYALDVTIDFLTSDYYNWRRLGRASFLPKPSETADIPAVDGGATGGAVGR